MILLNGDKKNYIWSARDDLGYLFKLSGPVIKVNGKAQQPILTKGTGPSRMKIWVAPLRIEPRPAKVLAEGKEIQYEYF